MRTKPKTEGEWMDIITTLVRGMAAPANAKIEIHFEVSAHQDANHHLTIMLSDSEGEREFFNPEQEYSTRMDALEDAALTIRRNMEYQTERAQEALLKSDWEEELKL